MKKVKSVKMKKMNSKKFEVVVVMGSRSDLGVMKAATAVLEKAGVSVHTQILSAHRTPELLEKSIHDWEKSGVKVLVAGAGGAAHLPGMLAAFSVLPVIGVPIKSSAMNGLDSLLSIVQMPKGVPVATVAVDNATNAGLLALQILAVGEESLYQKIRKQKSEMQKLVIKDRKKLSRVGIKKFLKSHDR